MASVRSLGIREPSALPYLIAEGFLEADPPADSYIYHNCPTRSDDAQEIDEEILVAKSCVVWSRGGVIKRVLNLAVEGDEVVDAFSTTFARELLKQGKSRAALEEREDALVVIFRTQVHILLLSGDSHILPLSFEAHTAFACPNGFILQRKVVADDGSNAEPGSLLQHDLSTILESQGTTRTDSARPSLLVPDPAVYARRNRYRGWHIPRSYTCMDPMSDLGLLVFGLTDKATSLNDCHALPVNETIIYVSRTDELATTENEHETLCIAVTHDATKDTMTIWHVSGDVPLSARTKSKAQKATRKSTTSRRKSSNIYARGPGGPAPASREPHPLRQSFGGLAQSFADHTLPPPVTEAKGLSDIAHQLGPEFEQVGVQTRSARRVSSMLARTDLATGTERNAFHDLPVGPNTRKSMGRTARRGESVGSFSDRQSFGFRRRSSYHAATSILSTGTSFMNISGMLQTEDLDNPYQLDAMGNEILQNDDLRRELGFFKLTSFCLSDEGPVHERALAEVLVLPSPSRSDTNDLTISVCITDKMTEQIAIVNIRVETVSTPSRLPQSRRTKLTATSLRRGSGITAVSLLTDGLVQRLLVLTKTRQGQSELNLEAPWSAPFRLELPPIHLLNSPADVLVRTTPKRSKDQGARRSVPSSSLEYVSIDPHGRGGKFALQDSLGRSHLLLAELHPSDAAVADVLACCNHIYGTGYQDNVLVAFWEVQRWIKSRESMEIHPWTVLIITLFSMAVPFIDDKQAKTNTPSRRKGKSLLRSSSGTAIDLSNFNAMSAGESVHSSLMNQPSWGWLLAQSNTPPPSSLHPKSPKAARRQSDVPSSEEPAKDSLLLNCIGWAREFVQSPAGEAATGPEGYLPTSMNKDREARSSALAKLLVALHLYYEEQKLTPVSERSELATNSLPALLAQLGTWLRWESWNMHENGYYANESTYQDRWLIEETSIADLDLPKQPFEPPSLLDFIAGSIEATAPMPFPTLDLVANYNTKQATSTPSKAVLQITPRSFLLLTSLKHASEWSTPSDAMKKVDKLESKDQQLQRIPCALATPFNQALSSAKAEGRGCKLNRDQHEATIRTGAEIANKMKSAVHGASKDQHSIAASAFDADNVQRWDVSSEADRQAVTRLIFQEDRRLQEASKLVNQTRPPLVACTPAPDWSEAELLEAQKELAQLVARRTLSVASGRAMMHYSARVPLLTERVPIPAFSLQCIMTSTKGSETAQAMTFSADKSSFTEEKVAWAFFHNGASAGLMISRESKCIDTSWVLYNRPQELTNRHAGFLLALGLNNHLKSLAKWVAFKYLTPKHTMTSIGLLLGLSASYLGTQDQLITRLLSVHVTRLLPPGAAELNLSPLTQTTGIIGIGLLYHNSQHRRMSEVMVSELENNDSEEGIAEDQILRDEGYRLAAGFSLGLINLGRGKDMHGLHDLAVPERLLAIAVGTKNVNLVHVLDRATAGAVMAIAFVFLKTNNAAVAQKIDIPDTLHQFDYVRPDIFLLRTLARHLIMWDSIAPAQSFVTKSLPAAYQHRALLQKTKHLATEDMPFFNVIAGVCLAISLRFAGSRNQAARDLLLSYLDQFLRLSRLPCPHYDARVTLNSVRNCMDVVALATAIVVAGSGDLDVLRRLRSLHGRTDKDTPFGSHMAAHMALGTLFLGGGTMTFGTSNLAIASLCMAFYPLFPSDVLDNKVHLQALRHLWVLAVERRCLVCRDKETGNLVSDVDAVVGFKDGREVIIRTPGILPPFDEIRSVTINGDGWWPVQLDHFGAGDVKELERDGVLHVVLERQAYFDKPRRGDQLAEELRVLDELSMLGIDGVPSVNRSLAVRSHPDAMSGDNNPFEWIFGLKSFEGWDAKEKDLVLDVPLGEGREMLASRPSDARLTLERGLLPEAEGQAVSRRKLWEVKILLAWFERFDRDDQAREEAGEKGDRWSNGLWLRREVVESLRTRVWEMMQA
jgi:anaphase-promoting complex subunit 1